MIKILKLKKKHPRKQFRIGSVVVVGYIFKEYDLNEKELKELESDGCQAFIAIEEKAAPKKKVIKKADK